MSNRCGQNPVLMLGIEGTFGTANTTPTVKSGDKLDFTEVRAAIPIDRKTGQVVLQKMESNYGSEYVDVTMEGTLTTTVFDILLRAFTGDTASAWVNQNSNTREGLTLIKYFDDGTVGTTTDDKYDIVYGALIQQLVLTLAPNSNVTYSATFKAKAVNRNLTNSGDDALTFSSITNATHPNNSVARWVDITASLGGAAAISAFNSATLTLTNELCGDDILFQNNSTIINPLILGTSGTLNCSWIYDTDDDPTIYNNLQNTLQTDTITILFGTKDQYAIVTEGKIESYESPDPGKCKYISSFTKKLMGDFTASPADVALTVTYADIS